MIATVAMGTAIAAPADASGVPAADRATNLALAPGAVPMSGEFQQFVYSSKYDLYWDLCIDSGGNQWIYLEKSYSVCGSSPGGVWGFVFMSAKSQQSHQRSLEVCMSNDHSGTMKLLDSDLVPPTHSLDDSAGGGCATATRTDVVDWWGTWGGFNSARAF